ncbi:MAG: hypothetical protein V7L29_11795 [Nostoc sp.]|uniref:hypothetical protein n=1 Tax=Nostoc sp. TaxID=1180 RepID=UPI002FF3528C
MQRKNRLNPSASGFFVYKFRLIGVVFSQQISSKNVTARVAPVMGQYCDFDQWRIKAIQTRQDTSFAAFVEDIARKMSCIFLKPYSVAYLHLARFQEAKSFFRAPVK